MTTETTTTNVKLTDWEFSDMGFDNPQYWPGFGVSCTRFEHCDTGCGSTAAEAMSDLLNCMGMSGNCDNIDLDDLEAQLLKHCNLTSWPDDCFESDEQSDDESDDDDGNEMCYYVGIRYNLPGEVESDESAE